MNSKVDCVLYCMSLLYVPVVVVSVRAHFCHNLHSQGFNLGKIDPWGNVLLYSCPKLQSFTRQRRQLHVTVQSFQTSNHQTYGIDLFWILFELTYNWRQTTYFRKVFHPRGAYNFLLSSFPLDELVHYRRLIVPSSQSVDVQ